MDFNSLTVKKVLLRIQYLLSKPKNLVAVVIPIYRSTLSKYEKISLSQCLKILAKYPIIIISPLGLVFDLELEEIIKNLQRETFKPDFFIDTKGYNRLMTSKEFYERFVRFRFVLIHQLDAFVFRDELTDWCQKNFDYIGAPWMDMADWQLDSFWSGWYYQFLRAIGKPIDIELPKTGNGGFSLRKVKNHLLALYLLRSKAWYWSLNEDIFWGAFLPGNLPFFKVASYKNSLSFSFEVDPRRCYKENQEHLPFGCHAWWNYDINFWQPFIEKYGYKF